MPRAACCRAPRRTGGGGSSLAESALLAAILGCEYRLWARGQVSLLYRYRAGEFLAQFKGIFFTGNSARN